VTAEMFVGCFKTLLHAVEALILESGAPPQSKLQAVGRLRLFADAYTTLLVGDWTSLSEREARDNLDESNRMLTLEKCKYENILSSISDLVLVADEDGTVIELNQSAVNVLGGAVFEGQKVWRALGLEGRSVEEMLRFYPLDQSHEISIAGEEQFFELKIIPLSRVSLASNGYILVLNDITAHVMQRSALEQVVSERTEDLQKEKAQLEEMVITLKNVMQTAERGREEHAEAVAITVRETLLPALGRIRAESASLTQGAYLDLLEEQLIKLAPGKGPDTDARLLKLTPTEMKVCRQIMTGSSSKDIADALNLSVGTVNTHRKNIRKKLNLQGRDVNLFTYLQSRTETV
jgi:DNA-binding CsgD family transcriptional regulator/PAS domain-containing protein